MRPQPVAISRASVPMILAIGVLLAPSFAGGTGTQNDARIASRMDFAAAAQDSCAAAPGENTRARSGGTIAGQVFDDSRKPLGGVIVTVQRAGFANATTQSGTYERTVTTDAKGQYRLEDVPVGDYYINAVMKTPELKSNSRDKSPQAAKFGFGPTFYPGTTIFANAQRVSVHTGLETGGIDIPVEKKRLARISGRMVAYAGHLMDGAFVGLAPAASAGQAALSRLTGVGHVTADGEFAIDGVPPGEYVLRGQSIPLSAVAEIARTGSSAPLTAHVDGEFASLPLTVEGSDIANVQLMLKRGGRVRGRVDIDGQPAQGRQLIIQAQPTSAESFSAGNNDALVERSGAFEIRGLAGVFVFRLAGDVRGATLARVEIHGQDVTDTGIGVDPGADLNGLQISLTSRVTQVSGHISPHTAPSTCWVVVFSADPERWSWPASRFVAAARVGPQGAFRVDGLPPGKYLAAAVGPIEEGQWRDPDYLTSLARQSKSIELHEGERKELEIPPTKSW